MVMFFGFFWKNFVSERENFIFAIHFVSDFFVADDIEKRAEKHKDI